MDPWWVHFCPARTKLSNRKRLCSLKWSLRWCLLPLIPQREPSALCFPLHRSLSHTLSPGRRIWNSELSCIEIFSSLGQSCERDRRWGETSNGNWEWVMDATGEKPGECYPRGHVECLKMEEMINWVECCDRSGKVRTENWPLDLIKRRSLATLTKAILLSWLRWNSEWSMELGSFFCKEEQRNGVGSGGQMFLF